MGMTPQHFHTSPTSCAILPTTHTTKFLHALNLFMCIEWTQLCSLHSLTLKRRPISPMFSGNKISTTDHKTQHCSCTPQFLHTVKTDHICHAQYTNYIAATRNITYSPCTSKCTTHSPLPSHNPSLHTTNNHKAYLCKWRQNDTRCKDGV